MHWHPSRTSRATSAVRRRNCLSSSALARGRVRMPEPNLRRMRLGFRSMRSLIFAQHTAARPVIHPGHCGAEIGMKGRCVCQVFVKRRLIADREPRSQTPLGRGIGPLSTGLHFGHPLPRSIENFVNDDRGTPGGGGSRLALQEVHRTNFSSGIFSVIGPWVSPARHPKSKESLLRRSVGLTSNNVPYFVSFDVTEPCSAVTSATLYKAAKMLRGKKDLCRAAEAKTNRHQVPKSKEPLPIQGVLLTTQMGFTAVD